MGGHAGDVTVTETACNKTTPAHDHPVGSPGQGQQSRWVGKDPVPRPQQMAALKFKITSMPFPSALGTGVNTEMRRGEFPYLEDEEAPDMVPRACVCIGTIAAI